MPYRLDLVESHFSQKTAVRSLSEEEHQTLTFYELTRDHASLHQDN